MASTSDQAIEEALHGSVQEMKLGLNEEETFNQVPTQADEVHKEGQEQNHNSLQDTSSKKMSEQELRDELERVKEERNSFEGQYRGLLGKLGQMRSTLGDRLRQDAEELDRREQQIESLNTHVEDLSATVQTLKDELVGSHEDVERISKELDAARSLHQQQNDSASSDRKGSEARLRELQELSERYRIDAESWESACMEERAAKEDMDLQVREARRECEEARAREEEKTQLAAQESETSRGLQQVLEEFQAAQESELQRALGDHEEKVARLSALLEEKSDRSSRAEALASDYKGAAERCQTLEKEVKEKNLLIGKLRHEAVILNEHLTESLRRLRANTSESNVDGRLITNLLLQFLNTPRSDSKRFEMLALIASVLNWGAEEKEKAGLQPKGTGSSIDRKLGVSAIRNGGGHKRQGAGVGSSDGAGEEVSLMSYLANNLIFAVVFQSFCRVLALGGRASSQTFCI